MATSGSQHAHIVFDDGEFERRTNGSRSALPHAFQCPDITDRLGPMYELIEARTRLYPKLARLHGKLSLIASQVA